ncbi:type II secretion system minor pseudopilin GspK [Pseudomarimonas salicorniae]|uniref:Type II secretion system protein K n=1 Tax=Pseudomarimonas salicorniae TaxID=2933270 RepID=A0ABT0GDZ5_9GAMM|nr:type II secretion system minor pseudopilin GspK [Lysobacter sp. CAU 1642]
MTRRSRQRPGRERGVALLAAIVVVALATVLVAALLDQGEQSRARSRNLLRAEQTWQLALGAEYWAMDALRRDYEARPEFDARGDGWSQPLPPVPLPGGQLLGRLRDAGACLDLNRLADAAAAPLQRQRLERLLRALELDPRLLPAIVDWIDANAMPETGGAEDGRYLARNPAYRAANRPMAHISELRLVDGVDGKVYERLAPHVCALPEPAPMNLNFLTPPLWMSLSDEITAQTAQQLWRDGQANYQQPDQLRDEAQRLGFAPPPLEGLSVHSTWFALEAEVDVDGLPFQYAALIRRDRAGLRTHVRLRGRW